MNQSELKVKTGKRAADTKGGKTDNWFPGPRKHE